MELLENKNTQKRRGPKAGKLILAAALAVGCVLSIAAGLPARVYNFATGGQVISMPGTNEVHMTVGDMVDPIKAEDGRLWFEADGQTVDITGLVDEDTPYIYERIDSGSGEKGYIVVGGTIDHFGWTEFSVVDGKITAQAEHFSTDYLTGLPDGSEVSMFDLTDEQRAQLADENGAVTGRMVKRPWYQAALDQLGLEG